MMTLSLMLAALLCFARWEWRRVQAHEAKVAELRRQLDQLAGLTRDATRCEVCRQRSQWLIPVMLYDSIEWTCPACSELLAPAQEAA